MIRTIAAAVMACLVAGPAAAFDPAKMTEDERAAFRAEIRAYLMENPEIIVEAVNLLEERKAAQQAALDVELVRQYARDIFEDGHSWIGGNPDGDITLVEFMDYRCGFCRRAVPEVEDLLASDGNIRVIIKEFPILGPDSMASSRFAIAAQQVAGEAAYKLAHDALLQFEGEVNEMALRRLGDGLGLDTESILAHMNDDAVTQIIAENRALAQALQINGTPTFILEDEMLRGYLTAEQMAQIIAELRG